MDTKSSTQQPSNDQGPIPPIGEAQPGVATGADGRSVHSTTGKPIQADDDQVIERLAKDAENQGRYYDANCIRNQAPKGFWGNIKHHGTRPVTARAAAAVIIGGVVLYASYQLVAWLLRNRWILPGAVQFQTGKAADIRRAAGAMSAAAKSPAPMRMA